MSDATQPQDAQPVKQLPLVFDEPRGRKKPPRHLADLTEPERAALLVEAGLPGYRAKQLSNHYFARLVDDPADMTDLPAAQRDDLVATLLPDPAAEMPRMSAQASMPAGVTCPSTAWTRWSIGSSPDRFCG